MNTPYRSGLAPILASLAAGADLTLEQSAQLLCLTLAQSENYRAFDFRAETLPSMIERHAQFVQTDYRPFVAFCQDRLGLYQDESPRSLALSESSPQSPVNEVLLHNLWHFWLPVAEKVKQNREQHDRLWIQGIVGLQGTGKTTLTAILTWILNQWGYRCVSLSLDDLYLPYLDRLKLQEEQPSLIWRGPPGTHDVDLGLAVIDRFQNQQVSKQQIQNQQTEIDPLEVPRFDKSLYQGAGDRGQPEWVTPPIDILFLEGWFVGVYPLEEGNSLPFSSSLGSPLMQYCNAQLRRYIALWEKLDHLLVLYLSNPYFSKQWRKEAEQNMRNRGQSAMTDETIDRFVAYFWEALPPELFLNRLMATPNPPRIGEREECRALHQLTPPRIVAEIQNDRRIGTIFRAGN